MNRVAVLRCLAAAVLFGASTPAASLLAGDMPTLMLAGLLYIGAALAVVPFVMRRPPRRDALRASWKPLATAVIVGGAIGPALLVAGLARTPSATASLMLNLELVATVVLAALVFGEHLGGRVLGGGALILTAGVLLVWQPGAQLTGGALLVFGACLCWGVDNNLTAHLDQIAPEHITFLKGAVAGTANLVLALMVSQFSSVQATQVVAALAIGALGYGASITLWVRGARDLGAARGQVIFAAAPFVGAIVAWVVLGDPVDMTQVLAMGLAGAGVWLSLDSAHQHAHVHEGTTHDHEHVHDDEHHDHEHPDGFLGRHAHPHEHERLVHVHPHTPDLHHRHDH
ncbi:MAG: DMT family transporter [Acidimicrobiales bacterium]|nr:DMT family transporter [Acidimicrobiales bacterium]